MMDENRITARFVLCIYRIYAIQSNIKIPGAFHEFGINLWGKGLLLKDLKLESHFRIFMKIE